KVALVEQMETPAQAKERGHKFIDRQVVRVLTPASTSGRTSGAGVSKSRMLSTSIDSVSFSTAFSRISSLFFFFAILFSPSIFCFL
ncbi:MAG: hypothetical protein IJ944_01110, partial [Clostridia bacterium]|nr:hypothetical protein [Clostridia bacterium]